MNENAKIIKHLRDAYEEAWPPTMRFFEWCADQLSTPRETTIEKLQSALRLSRSETPELVSGIVTSGIGKRIIGRHGAKSRIVWDFTLQSVERVASGETEILQKVGSKPFTSQHLIEYSYPLRDDEPPITIKLPRDLTRREADRLAMFIQSLPKG
jgi:hypothetical protein